jgi:hypothetical protein
VDGAELWELVEDLAGDVNEHIDYQYILDEPGIEPLLSALLQLILVEEIFHVPEESNADAYVAEGHQGSREGCYDKDEYRRHQLQANEAEDLHLASKVENECLVLKFL